MNSKFLYGFVTLTLLITFLTGCSNREKSENQEIKNNKNYSTVSTDAAKELNLKPVKPGVWLATRDPLHPEKEMRVPIEVITDPVIADRASKGLRPDGEVMYRFPDSLPEGYPPEALEHSIDIFPVEIPLGEGVSKGVLILYGHFLEPPYKFQVVVADVTDDREGVRLLVNGIDMHLVTGKRGRYLKKPWPTYKVAGKKVKKTQRKKRFGLLTDKVFDGKEITSISIEEHDEYIKSVIDKLTCEKKSYDEKFVELRKILSRDPRVETKSIKRSGEELLEYVLYGSKDQSGQDRKVIRQTLVSLCFVRDRPVSSKVTPRTTLADRIKSKIYIANREASLLGMSPRRFVARFRSRRSGLHLKEYNLIKEACKNGAGSFQHLSEVERIMGTGLVIEMLVNCSR